MTKKVWIFGDSYSSNEWGDPTSWPARLETKYELTNFSLGGTGPEYMINLFRQNLENAKINDLRQINLIFFLSHDSRKDFSFLQEPKDQCYMNNVTSWDKQYNRIYCNNKKFIENFYKYYYLHNNLCDFDHIKWVGVIKEFSRFFNKTIVVPVFDDPNLSILKSKFDSNISNNGNFTYSKGPALYFVEKEINGDEPNHLCQENHDLLYNQLVDWIESDICLDTNRLKKIS